MASSVMAESALSKQNDKEVRPLLDLVDELRSLGIEQDLPLPQIAVMGDQSSGKSSVLEALSGVPFPRGTGLRGVGADQGSASGFSTDSIVVTVNAPSVPDLTIIDLPGIVRTATQGQDPRDVATVDILERALTVDPTGERTIGVLTKPDLIGEAPGRGRRGAEERAQAAQARLHHGQEPERHAAQAGRHQQPRRERARAQFFVQHPVWKTVDRNLLGVANLTAKLTKLLTKRIASVLPELNARGDYREQILSQNPRLRLRAVADRVFRQLEQEISEQKPDFEAHDFTMKLHQELKALRGRELPGLLNSYFFYGFMARHVEIGVAVSTSPVFHA
ncbi:hypothetical protein JL722_14630 [Aureococcus anophagefferens]|nr:hypothetical protein JL722_14630 [Aureococcus anophagefferens]